MKALSVIVVTSLLVGTSVGQKFNSAKRGESQCTEAAKHMELSVGPALKSPEITHPIITNAPGCYLFLSNDWNYEICVNQYIRQFRTDGKPFIVAENYLGFAHRVDEVSGLPLQYENRRKTVKQSIDEAFTVKIASSKFEKNKPKCEKGNIVAPFTGGTMCAAVNRPRQATVKYMCSPEDTDDLPEMMTQIVEVETCKYEIILAGRLACKLMGQKYEMNKEEFTTMFGPVLEAANRQRENARIQKDQALEKEYLRLAREAEALIAAKANAVASSEEQVVNDEADEFETTVGLEPNEQSLLWAAQMEADARGEVDLFSFFGGAKNRRGDEDHNIPLSV